MLDFSVSEIGLIGVVALVAIGPERLPKVARAAGVLLGRFRRYAISVKADIDREIQQAELKDLQKKMNEAAREAEQAMATSAREAEAVLSSPAAPGVEPVAPVSTPAVAEPPQATAEFPVAAAPFGGDPFSARPAAPLRSKPMASPQARLALDDQSGSEAQ